MSPRLLWWQGHTPREIAAAVGGTTDGIRARAKRAGWTRSVDGQARYEAKLLELTAGDAQAVGAMMGNQMRWGAGWPPMRGEPEERDARFVRAFVLEALACGLLKREAAQVLA